MKKISILTVRNKAVETVLASLRIEQLSPSEYVIKELKACMSKQNTAAKVLQELMRHHY